MLAVGCFWAAGRFGGEQFLLVLPECSLEEGVELGERICHLVSSAPVKTKNERIEWPRLSPDATEQRSIDGHSRVRGNTSRFAPLVPLCPVPVRCMLSVRHEIDSRYSARFGRSIRYGDFAPQVDIVSRGHRGLSRPCRAGRGPAVQFPLLRNRRWSHQRGGESPFPGSHGLSVGRNGKRIVPLRWPAVSALRVC